MKKKIFVFMELSVLIIFFFVARFMYYQTYEQVKENFYYKSKGDMDNYSDSYWWDDWDRIRRGRGTTIEATIYDIEKEFSNRSTDQRYLEDTYIIARLYDEDMNLIEETGSYIKIAYPVKNSEEQIYIRLDQYFTREKLDSLCEYEEKYRDIEVSKVSGYYEKERFIPITIRINPIGLANGVGEYLEITTGEASQEVVTYEAGDDMKLEGIFPKTMATQRPASISEENGNSFIDYLIEKKAGMRASKLIAKAEILYDNTVLPNLKKEDGGDGGSGDRAFNYCSAINLNNQRYYLGLVVYTDLTYATLVSTNIVESIITLFVYLQIGGIILAVGVTGIYSKQKQLDKMRIDLTNGVAHEMKTPLAVIKNYGECMKEEVNVKKNTYYLDSIIDESDRMNSLIINMLNYSRYSNRSYRLKKELCALDELVDAVIREKQALMEAKKIKVTVTCNNSMEVRCDGSLIQLVIGNLLTNAIQHSPEGNTITVDLVRNASRINPRIRCSISNIGKHVLEDEKKAIWDVYYRGDKSRNRGENSTGFGLAIASSIVKLHKGKYGCENIEDKVCFYFELKV